MILRRVIEHVKAQNWTAVALDFAIVVLGVFIGIQVSNWNDARSDRRDEVATLQALHEEISRAENVNFRALKYRLSYAEGISSAVDVLFGNAPDRDLTEEECTALIGSHILYMGRADLPALTALQSSGRLDIIRDRELRQSLSALIQGRESLDAAMQLNQYLHDIPHLYSDAFTLTSVLEASDRRPDLERTSRATCEIDVLRENKQLMYAVAQNADGYDAFMRDGLRPWLQQFNDTHQQLDAFLKISHEKDTDN